MCVAAIYTYDGAVEDTLTTSVTHVVVCKPNPTDTPPAPSNTDAVTVTLSWLHDSLDQGELLNIEDYLVT